MRRFVAILFFLVLANDTDTTYAQFMWAPMSWVQPILMEPRLSIRPYDVIMLVILGMAYSQGQMKGPWVAPMRKAVLLALGTTVTWFLYGLVTGGALRFASWQTYLILSTVLVTFTFAAVYKTPQQFITLVKAFMAASTYRAVMCWIGYFKIVRPWPGDHRPEYTSAHDDTVLWVVSVLALVVYVLYNRKRGSILRAVLGLVLFLGAIQWNSRRLAWVSLAMAGIAMVALIPPGAARRKIKRFGLIVGPALALYVIIGMNSDAHIFRPVQSFATVGTQEDNSTKARNNENLGLIATANQSNRFTGTGWGHPYVEVSNKYSIASIFELWQYIPHNSLLGLLAYTGLFGFAGFWLAFPTAVFLLARMARFGTTPLGRSLGIMGILQLIVVGNQLYGDMGIFFVRSMYVVSAAYAVAMRFPPLVGAWPTPATGAAATATAAVRPQGAHG